MLWSRNYSRYSSTPIHMQPMGGRLDRVTPPSATTDAAAPAAAGAGPSASPPAWSPMQAGNRERAAGGLARIGFKRGRSDEEGDGGGGGGGGGGASLVAGGLEGAAAAGLAAGNSAKRRALASRLSQGDRRTWRAGATPGGAARLPALPAPEVRQTAAAEAPSTAATPGAHAARLNSSAARRILMSLQTVDVVRP